MRKCAKCALSAQGMAAARRIAERNGVDVKKVMDAYAKVVSSPKMKLSPSVLFLAR